MTDKDDGRAEQLRLRNRTNCKLIVPTTTNGSLVISPLDVLGVESKHLDDGLLQRAQDAGVLECSVEERPAVAVNDILPWLGWGIALGFFAVIALVDSGGEDRDPTFGIAAAVGASVCVLVAVGLAITAFGHLRNVFSGLQRGAGRVRELLYFAAATLIVLAFPGALIYFGADAKALYEAASGTTESAVTQDQAVTALVGFAVQGLCIAGASVLPVALYFVFDRVKLRTLRERFNREIFRLDPSVTTLSDVQAKYGQMIDEVYGRQSDNRLLPGARSPILLAAAVMTIGWTVALLDDVVTLDFTSPVSSPDLLTGLLTPTASAATFAFLGGYFFALNAVLRGYVRGDLRPKTYAEVAGRIVGVVVLAFVLERLVAAAGGDPRDAPLLAVAFLAGIVPETALVRIREVAQGRSRPDGSGGRLAPIYEAQPLTDIEGIDIYDRARLNSEGVTNVEGLAHHDLIDLLLKTRIPAPRLVDWVDQAILRIHCADDDDEPLYARLHGQGIRTATDLEQAYRGALERDEGPGFLAEANGGTPVLRIMLDAVADEEWMCNIRYWRSAVHQLPPRTLHLREALDEDPTLVALLSPPNLAPAWKLAALAD